MGTETDIERLVRQAVSGDLRGFVELTRRFQHFAFGSALALVHDFQQAEDVVQDAFVAAWTALPSLAEPAAFPGWLRGIVRHHAFRVIRRKHLEELPLAAVADVPSEEQAPDERLLQRQQAAAVLAAIAELPTSLREPATLFFVHDCSHQDIAAFMGLSTVAVNNRLHAARAQLKKRTLAMMKDTIQSHGLPADFATRIGRLLGARGEMMEALFDPASLPDLLTELVVSDEGQRRAVAVQVVQRPGGGVVRGVATTSIDAVPRGASVLSSGRHTATSVTEIGLERIMPLLAGQKPTATDATTLLETGIKVIDVMCPLAASGSVALAGEYGAGLTVVMEELVRRLSGGSRPVSLLVLMPPPSPLWPASLAPDFSHAAELKKEGYSEGTLGAVQTFFLRGQKEPWTAEQLSVLKTVDIVIHLSRAQAVARVYPTVDPLTSQSRLLKTKAVSEEHAAIAVRARDALATLRASDANSPVVTERIALERASKLQNFFTQPFFVAEPYTKRPGVYVSLSDALSGCREILDGLHDDLPVEAFYFTGNIADIRRRASEATS